MSNKEIEKTFLDKCLRCYGADYMVMGVTKVEGQDEFQLKLERMDGFNEVSFKQYKCDTLEKIINNQMGKHLFFVDWKDYHNRWKNTIKAVKIGLQSEGKTLCDRGGNIIGTIKKWTYDDVAFNINLEFVAEKCSALFMWMKPEELGIILEGGEVRGVHLKEN